MTHKLSIKGFNWVKDKVIEPKLPTSVGGKAPKGEIPKTEPTLKPLGLGSTGRTEPKNLIEQMAMKSIVENPNLGEPITRIESLSDPRWLGWTKMRYKVETETGMKVTIHYVAKWENGVLKAVDDNLNL